MNEILINTVIDLLAFLELSGDDVINPDAALQTVEDVAGTLQRLSPEDKRAFIDYVQGRANEERRKGAKSERIEFLTSLPNNLGLNDYSHHGSHK